MTRTTKASIRQYVSMGALCAVALTLAACAEGLGTPTSPGGTAARTGLNATAAATPASPRRGALEVTKECSEYTGLAGSFCTVTSSNLAAIEVGSKIVYAQASGETSLDSDITLDPPGPGNNVAYGHCILEYATGVGTCSFSGGTGRFTFLRASVAVSYLGGFDWGWDGSFDFGPLD